MFALRLYFQRVDASWRVGYAESGKRGRGGFTYCSTGVRVFASFTNRACARRSWVSVVSAARKVWNGEQNRVSGKRKTLRHARGRVDRRGNRRARTMGRAGGGRGERRSFVSAGGRQILRAGIEYEIADYRAGVGKARNCVPLSHHGGNAWRNFARRRALW
jgi:hypothetical protein